MEDDIIPIYFDKVLSRWLPEQTITNSVTLLDVETGLTEQHLRLELNSIFRAVRLPCVGEVFYYATKGALVGVSLIQGTISDYTKSVSLTAEYKTTESVDSSVQLNVAPVLRMSKGDADVEVAPLASTRKRARKRTRSCQFSGLEGILQPYFAPQRLVEWELRSTSALKVTADYVAGNLFLDVFISPNDGLVEGRIRLSPDPIRLFDSSRHEIKRTFNVLLVIRAFLYVSHRIKVTVPRDLDVHFEADLRGAL